MLVHIDENSPAAMLVAKRSAVVTPEVHLGIQKQGYQWPHKKDSCLPNFLLLKNSNKSFKNYCISSI